MGFYSVPPNVKYNPGNQIPYSMPPKTDDRVDLEKLFLIPSLQVHSNNQGKMILF